MKNAILTYGGLILLLTIGTNQTLAQVGVGTTNPNASSALDIVSNERGLLVPRIALTQTSVAAPVVSPASSLLVFNTATANDVVPGFYYWSGSENKWIAMAGSEVTANNGLTKTSSNIQLGGVLIEPTTITTNATNTLSVEGLVALTGQDLEDVNGIMTVETDGTVRTVYSVYSASAAQNTLKKWIDGKSVLERVGVVTLASTTNVLSLVGVVPTGSKLLGVRLINRTNNAISTNIIEYNSSTGILVLGTSGTQTVLHPAGTYDVVVEYVNP